MHTIKVIKKKKKICCWTYSKRLVFNVYVIWSSVNCYFLICLGCFSVHLFIYNLIIPRHFHDEAVARIKQEVSATLFNVYVGKYVWRLIYIKCQDFGVFSTSSCSGGDLFLHFIIPQLTQYRSTSAAALRGFVHLAKFIQNVPVAKAWIWSLTYISQYSWRIGCHRAVGTQRVHIYQQMSQLE